jgi:hypothetical protein
MIILVSVKRRTTVLQHHVTRFSVWRRHSWRFIDPQSLLEAGVDFCSSIPGIAVTGLCYWLMVTVLLQFGIKLERWKTWRRRILT